MVEVAEPRRHNYDAIAITSCWREKATVCEIDTMHMWRMSGVMRRCESGENA